MGLLSSLFGSGEREKPRRRMMKGADNYWERTPEETDRLTDESNARMAEARKQNKGSKRKDGKGYWDKTDTEFWGKIFKKGMKELKK